MTVRPAEAEPLPHEHDWRLVAVDYEDGLEVHELTCPRCGVTIYR